MSSTSHRPADGGPSDDDRPTSQQSGSGDEVVQDEGQEEHGHDDGDAQQQANAGPRFAPPFDRSPLLEPRPHLTEAIASARDARGEHDAAGDVGRRVDPNAPERTVDLD